MRARLKDYVAAMYEKEGLVAQFAHEIEGFLFRGRDAERNYPERGAFEFISTTAQIGDIRVFMTALPAVLSR